MASHRAAHGSWGGGVRLENKEIGSRRETRYSPPPHGQGCHVIIRAPDPFGQSEARREDPGY